ncbi:MAG: DedA family protein [Mycobacteriaceae bacterium]
MDLFNLQHTGITMVWILVLIFVFLECAFILGLFLPGDSLLITAGILLAAHGAGSVNAWALAAGTAAAAVFGNHVGYRMGTHAGKKISARKNGKYLHQGNLDRAQALMTQHGFWAVLIARWVPWIRTLCPIMAGAAGMDPRRYTIASIIGAVIWAPVLILLGFYFGSALSGRPWLIHGIALIMVLFLVIGTGIGIYQYRKEMRCPIDTEEA